MVDERIAVLEQRAKSLEARVAANEKLAQETHDAVLRIETKLGAGASLGRFVSTVFAACVGGFVEWLFNRK